MNRRNKAILERFEKTVSGFKKIRSPRLSYVDDLVVLVCDPSAQPFLVVDIFYIPTGEVTCICVK